MSSFEPFQRPQGCDVARGDAAPQLGLVRSPGDASSIRVSAKHAESGAGKVALLGIVTGAAGCL